MEKANLLKYNLVLSIFADDVLKCGACESLSDTPPSF